MKTEPSFAPLTDRILPVRLRDPVTGQERMTLDGDVGPVYALTFLADGTTLAGHGRPNVVLWKAARSRRNASR
jgi:hypothetical protein